MRQTTVLKRGFGLVEIVVATGVISISLFSLITAAIFAFRSVDQSFFKARAEFLAREGVEAVRVLRDTSWSLHIDPLLSGTAYYIDFASSDNTWSIGTTNPGIIDGIFTRTIVFEDVYRRDSDYDIVPISSSDPKTLDLGTKKVTAQISWLDGDAHMEISTYITNLFQN